MAPKIIQKEEKRAEILKAAMSAFARKGFSNTRMEDISKEANIGKGTLYEYFNSKEDLFFTLYEKVRDQFYETIYRDVRGEESALKALTSFITATLKAFKEWQDFGFVLLDVWSEHRRGKTVHLKFRDVYQYSRGQVANLIRQGMKSGEFRKVDPFIAASTIIAVLDGFLLQRIFDPETFQGKDAEKAVVDTVIHGLKA